MHEVGSPSDTRMLLGSTPRLPTIEDGIRIQHCSLITCCAWVAPNISFEGALGVVPAAVGRRLRAIAVWLGQPSLGTGVMAAREVLVLQAGVRFSGPQPSWRVLIGRRRSLQRRRLAGSIPVLSATSTM